MFLIPSHPHFVSPSIFPATSFGPRWKPIAQRVENKRFDIKSSRACSFLPFDFKSLIWSILHWTSLVSCLLSPVLHSCSYTVHLPVFLSFSVTVKFLESPSNLIYSLYLAVHEIILLPTKTSFVKLSLCGPEAYSLYTISLCVPHLHHSFEPRRAWLVIAGKLGHSQSPPPTTLCWSRPVAEDTLMRCSTWWPWLGWGHNSFHSFLLNP